MRKYLLLLAAAALLAAPRANAFVATTGPDIVATPDTNGNLIADPGEKFTVGLNSGVTLGSNPANPFPAAGDQNGLSGRFATYVSAPGEPVVKNDLNLYRFLMDGTAQTVVGTNVNYKGRYLVFYDQNNNNKADGNNTLPNGDFVFSGGTFDVNAAFDATGNAILSGTMNQDIAPTVPPFADFGALFGTVYIDPTGSFYQPTVPGQQGLLTLKLTGTSQAIPEPGTLALLGTGVLPLLGLRRRRA